jgi:hypothetical protein
MDGQVWLFINQMSERSDGEEGMCASRKRSNACLDWPDHESLIEARHLRARTVWRWAAEAMSRLLRQTTSRVRESAARGAK